MKATDLWKPGGKPTVSFELYPPKSEKAAETLEKIIVKLIALNPDFFSVTFGAGGSTREGSKQLLDKLKNEKKQDVIAYFAGYGLGPEEITAALDDYQSIGVTNLLVVRGDKPEDENFSPHPDSFAHASDLLEFIKPKYAFCLGAAGYPEGHVAATSKEKDLEYLKLKIDCGAEFIIANYFYDNRYFFDFLDRCQSSGITVPIIPGVMPIYSVKMLEILAGLCGATITDEVRQGLAGLPEGDKDALNDFGVDFASRQCEELLKAGVPGLHIYTIDRSKSAVGLINRLRNQVLI